MVGSAPRGDWHFAREIIGSSKEGERDLGTNKGVLREFGKNFSRNNEEEANVRKTKRWCGCQVRNWAKIQKIEWGVGNGRLTIKSCCESWERQIVKGKKWVQSVLRWVEKNAWETELRNWPAKIYYCARQCGTKWKTGLSQTNTRV